MQFGYFDDGSREYVITRPVTPRSWTNFLGNTTYGGVISNNAAGFAFYRSGERGRILRMPTNAVPSDRPGRYVYLRDQDDGDHWSASWQPVGKPATDYRSECRHGTGYTIISSAYRDIATETCYLIPEGCAFECWRVTIANHGVNPRRLRVFPFVEWSNSWNRSQDLDNLQYTQYIVDCTWHDGIIERAQNANLREDYDDLYNDDCCRRCWMTVAGATITGFDTDRTAFIGPYCGYDAPRVVAEGACRGSLAQCDNAVGVLQIDIALEAGEERAVVVMLGVGGHEVAAEVLRSHGSLERFAEELARIKECHHGAIDRLTCSSPDPAFDSWINTWSPYNALVTFNWSRAASFVYNGDRDGLGYRDTLQDLMAASALCPVDARSLLLLMLSGQERAGNAKRVVQPTTHIPGSMPPTEPHLIRSDDCLWLFEAVRAYVCETGDEAILDECVAYWHTATCPVSPSDGISQTAGNHLVSKKPSGNAPDIARGVPRHAYADRRPESSKR